MDDQIDAIFDTNIFIYLTNGEEKYIHFLESDFDGDNFALSSISATEALMGARDDEEERDLTENLSQMIVLPFTSDVAISTAKTLRKREQKNLRSRHFADTVIAHTALSLDIPLVTNNPKDFAVFEGLEVVVP